MEFNLVLKNKIKILISVMPNESKAEMLRLILFKSKNTKVNSLPVMDVWRVEMVLNRRIKSLKE